MRWAKGDRKRLERGLDLLLRLEREARDLKRCPACHSREGFHVRRGLLWEAYCTQCEFYWIRQKPPARRRKRRVPLFSGP